MSHKVYNTSKHWVKGGGKGSVILQTQSTNSMDSFQLGGVPTSYLTIWQLCSYSAVKKCYFLFLEGHEHYQNNFGTEIEGLVWASLCDVLNNVVFIKN